MAQFYVLPNGEVVPVPREISGQGLAAEQDFYNGQLERVAVEAHAYAEKPSGNAD